MVAATCTHPLDLTKVRLQTAATPGQSLASMFLQIIKREGPLALYSGLSASLLRQGTYSTARFGVYESLKQQLQGYTYGSPSPSSNSVPDHVQNHLVKPQSEVVQQQQTLSALILLPLSMFAGAVGGAVGNPADVVNVRMQNDRSLPENLRRNYRNAFDGLAQITKSDGVLGLYTGLGPNIARGVLMTAAQVVSYDEAKHGLVAGFGLDPASKTTHFTASLFAALVATTVCSPVDVIKTRVMEAGPSNKKPIQILREAIKTEGPAFMFRGWLPSFMRLGPQTILTFLVLEQLKNYRVGLIN